MNNQYVLEQVSRDLLENGNLLLDTNVLIDSLYFEEEFRELLNELRSINCTLYVNDIVRTEFLGGTKSKDSLDDKTALLEDIAETIPSEQYQWDNEKHQELLLDFSRQANKFSSVDFELFLTTVKYSGNLHLLTRNHRDFSTKILNREGYITLLGDKKVRTYSILSYS